MNLRWFSASNFGDIITPHLLEKMGIDFYRDMRHRDHANFIGIGSVLEHVGDRDVVWGSGIMGQNEEEYPINKKAKYLAVRGPLSGAKTGCTVYGDAGLLCSKYYCPDVPRGDRKRGYTPHYVDYRKLGVDPADEINLRCKTPWTVIDQIVRYRQIVSSSLHGIIIAHAYGIPTAWWRASDLLAGDDSKFQDYAESVDIELVPCKTENSLVFTLPKKEKIEEIQTNLENVLREFLFNSSEK